MLLDLLPLLQDEGAGQQAARGRSGPSRVAPLAPLNFRAATVSLVETWAAVTAGVVRAPADGSVSTSAATRPAEKAASAVVVLAATGRCAVRTATAAHAHTKAAVSRAAVRDPAEDLLLLILTLSS